MRIPVIGLALLLSLVGSTCARLPFAGDSAPAASGVAGLPLSRCHLESLAEEVQCGVLEVFEDRAAGSGRRIPIHVAVLPPLRRRTAPDPLFILSGGPGQGARGMAPAAARFFKAIRRTRAIVLVDLRGTGASAPLKCLRALDELQALSMGGDLFLGSGARCASELTANPKYYTHREALADLDEVRQQLGYARVNLWGGSWGTKAALIYALKYPSAVNRVVLDGAASLEMQFPRTVAGTAQRAFDLLLSRCAADTDCARAYPAPRAEFDALLARLERAPATVSIRHPRTGAATEVTITRAAVAEIVRVALYTTVDTARVLELVRSATRGDFAPLAAQQVHSANLTTDDMALGFTMAVLCSEDLPLVAGADFAADARDTAFGPAYAETWVERCRDWPRGAPLDVDRAAIAEAPALILSGVNDPVTPPETGESMTRHFRTHQHVVVGGAAHNASFTGCVPDLVAAFLDGQTIDASCVNEVPLPPLLTGTAGGRP